MPYWTYILQNETTGKLYKGQTSDLKSRVERHNTPESGSMRYTYKQKGLWRLIYSEEHSTRSEAMKREKFLKSGQGREWIKDNILKQNLSRQRPPAD
jgi:putative endonuclease